MFAAFEMWGQMLPSDSSQARWSTGCRIDIRQPRHGNPDAFAQWIASMIPGNNPKEGLGGAGGLLGGIIRSCRHRPRTADAP
jgi:hypothetical protein